MVPDVDTAVDLFSGSHAAGDLRVDWRAVAALEAGVPAGGWPEGANKRAGEVESDGCYGGSWDSGGRDGGSGVHAGMLGCATLAAAAQGSLEVHALALLRHLKETTGATRLCLSGGAVRVEHKESGHVTLVRAVGLG